MELKNILVLAHYDFDREFVAVNDKDEYVFVSYIDEDDDDPYIFNNGFICVATKNAEAILDFFNKKITFGELVELEDVKFKIADVNPLRDRIDSLKDVEGYDWYLLNDVKYWDYNGEKRDLFVKWLNNFEV